jgi:hypothetical protein
MKTRSGLAAFIPAELEEVGNSQNVTDADVREIEEAFAATGALNALPDEE